MNNGQPQGQQAVPNQPQQPGQQGQPAQPRPIQLYRPEQMRGLPSTGFSDQDKLKYENGLKQLWNAVENNPPESTQHQEAKKKIQEFSATLNKKVASFRIQAQQRAAASAGAEQRPASQGQQPPQSTQAGLAAANQPPRPPQIPQIPPHILEHVRAMNFIVPAHITKGSQEAKNWLQDIKNKYVKGLMTMEKSSHQISAMKAQVDKNVAEGKPLTPAQQKDYETKVEILQRQHGESKKFVDQFRAQQNAQRSMVEQQQAQQQNTAGNTPSSATQPGPPRPPMNSQQQTPNPAQQTTQAVNAAFEAARNQQMQGGRPPLPQNPGQPPQQIGQMNQNGQQQAQQQSQQQAQNSMPHPNMPQQQGGQMANIKTEGGANPPPINTAAAHQMQQQQNMHRPPQNSPQSAIPPQSATSQGPPRPLSHPAALAQAARTYSSGQTSGTPNVMGHSHAHPSIARETPIIATIKPQIPKNLHERAIAPPQPIPMAPARPSISGGPNNLGHGVMGQPVIPRAPGFQLEGEGERILSKKKLDELVRQVTGGGEGLSDGEGLTAEVEESVLQVADDFVDQVITSACKLAKIRGSKALEIRDIQLTLERNYNIRIPGYASDEIRTVRKFAPSPAWINKMSAIQAAKVTGGKADL